VNRAITPTLLELRCGSPRALVRDLLDQPDHLWMLQIGTNAEVKSFLSQDSLQANSP
jgi:hypothetical protein